MPVVVYLKQQGTLGSFYCLKLTKQTTSIISTTDNEPQKYVKCLRLGVSTVETNRDRDQECPSCQDYF